MNKVYGKVIALVSLSVTMFGSVLSFDELMKKYDFIILRSNNVSHTIRDECVGQYPTHRRILICNNALDEVNKLIPEYKSLEDELKAYRFRPGVSERRSELQKADVYMQRVRKEMPLRWRPLQIKIAEAKEHTTRYAKAVDFLIEGCKVPEDAYSLFRFGPEPKEKIAIKEECNQLIDIIGEEEGKYSDYLNVLANHGYSDEEMRPFLPKRRLKKEDIRYWLLLKNNQ